MNRGTLLTILICCYNGENFVDECLASLTAQAGSTPFKVVFIDDFSTDASLRILDKYAPKLPDPELIKNTSNLGLVSCCNLGLKAIDTPYYMRLDIDDYLAADAVERIAREIESCDEEIIAFNRWDIINGQKIKVRAQKDIYTWLAGGTALKTSSVKSAGGYNNEFWEEYDLYLKLLEAGCRYRVSERYIYYYRRGHQNMTADEERKKAGTRSLLDKWGPAVLEKYGDFKKALDYYSLKG